VFPYIIMLYICIGFPLMFRLLGFSYMTVLHKNFLMFGRYKVSLVPARLLFLSELYSLACLHKAPKH
jgi:hypothetical protein